MQAALRRHRLDCVVDWIRMLTVDNHHIVAELDFRNTIVVDLRNFDHGHKQALVDGPSTVVVDRNSCGEVELRKLVVDYSCRVGHKLKDRLDHMVVPVDSCHGEAGCGHSLELVRCMDRVVPSHKVVDHMVLVGCNFRRLLRSCRSLTCLKSQ